MPTGDFLNALWKVGERILEHDAACAELKSFNDLARGDRRGNHDRSSICSLVDQLAKCLESGQVRHQQVEEKNVWVLRVDGFDGFLSVFCNGDDAHFRQRL